MTGSWRSTGRGRGRIRSSRAPTGSGPPLPARREIAGCADRAQPSVWWVPVEGHHQPWAWSRSGADTRRQRHQLPGHHLVALKARSASIRASTAEKRSSSRRRISALGGPPPRSGRRRRPSPQPEPGPRRLPRPTWAGRDEPTASSVSRPKHWHPLSRGRPRGGSRRRNAGCPPPPPAGWRRRCAANLHRGRSHLPFHPVHQLVVDTTRPTRLTSMASTVRCLGPPKAVSPSPATVSGPSTKKPRLESCIRHR